MTTDGYRVAVVGGGIFGVTAALRLARAGHRVALYERRADLLMEASRANQRRLHRGYHYPRSAATARASAQGARSFVAEFPEAAVRGQRHYIAIARHDSLVSATDYVRFCQSMGLDFREEYPPFLRRRMVDLSLRVRETTIDIDALRWACWRRLLRAGVDVRLNTRWPVAASVSKETDWVVVATYAALNDIEGAAPASAVPYQFEICEKPLLRLPQEYRGTSMVVLDGPFMCFDPVAGTHDTFLAGNVRHAIHATTVGRYPLIPAGLLERLNNGPHRGPPDARWRAFIADGARFFAAFRRADYLGSFFTTRAVLPGLEDTDARPTVVRLIDERTVTVFGGKISTCVEAAHDVVRLVSGQPTSVDSPAMVRQRNEMPDYVGDVS